MGIPHGSTLPYHAQNVAETSATNFEAERGNRMSSKQTGEILLIGGLILLVLQLLADVSGVGGQRGSLGGSNGWDSESALLSPPMAYGNCEPI